MTAQKVVNWHSKSFPVSFVHHKVNHLE